MVGIPEDEIREGEKKIAFNNSQERKTLEEYQKMRDNGNGNGKGYHQNSKEPVKMSGNGGRGVFSFAADKKEKEKEEVDYRDIPLSPREYRRKDTLFNCPPGSACRRQRALEKEAKSHGYGKNVDGYVKEKEKMADNSRRLRAANKQLRGDTYVGRGWSYVTRANEAKVPRSADPFNYRSGRSEPVAKRPRGRPPGSGVKRYAPRTPPGYYEPQPRYEPAYDRYQPQRPKKFDPLSEMEARRKRHVRDQDDYFSSFL